MVANSSQRWLRVAAALLLASTSVAAQSTSSAPFVPEIAKTQLADGVFLLAGGPDGYVDGTNTVVVVNDNGVLVFDTSTRPSTARVILAEIRKITDKPVRYVVNSHWHPDHWSGNEIFADAFPNVEFIATEQAKTYMLNMGNFFAPRFKQRLPKTEATYASEIATGKDADGSTLSPKELADETTFMTRYRTFVAETQTVRRTYPTLTYVDELRLGHVGRGNQEIVLMSVTGDAEGTTVMYLPQAKVLVTGDAVSYPLPYTTPPPSRHAKSLRTLARLDVDAIVPGHGPVFRDRSFINLEAEFLETTVARVQVSLRKPLFLLADVQKDVNMDDFRVRFTKDDPTLNKQFAGFASGVVRLAYLESRDNQESRP